MDRVFRVVSMGVHLVAALALTILSGAFIAQAVIQTVAVIAAGTVRSRPCWTPSAW